jgi:hypothetical protein
VDYMRWDHSTTEEKVPTFVHPCHAHIFIQYSFCLLPLQYWLHHSFASCILQAHIIIAILKVIYFHPESYLVFNSTLQIQFHTSDPAIAFLFSSLHLSSSILTKL